MSQIQTEELTLSMKISTSCFALLLFVAIPSASSAPCTVASKPVASWSDQEWIQISQNHSKDWESQRAQGVNREVLRKKDGEGHVLFTGIPPFAKKISPQGRVFRHYVGEGLSDILASKRLRAGNLAYVRFSGGDREDYISLTGIFLTTPDFAPQQVGLKRDPHYEYVDLHLDPSIPLYQLEPGIYIIPGAQRFPDWCIQLYRDWSEHGIALRPSEKDLVDKITKTGLHPQEIPIQIISHRAKGK